MTDIYERMKELNCDNSLNQFNIMLDDALKKIIKKEPKKISREFQNIDNYIVKWVKPDESYKGPQRYIWVNFKSYMIELFQAHWGDHVVKGYFFELVLLPYLKNNYQIYNDKIIKLASVEIKKLNLENCLNEDYDYSYNKFANKKNITQVIVFEKIDGSNKGWINSNNLRETLLSFIRYYYKCENTTCSNYCENEISYTQTNGMIKKTCTCCNNSVFTNIK